MLLYQSWPGRAHVRRQGSALQQSRFDENLKIAEDYICNIKPPFKNFLLKYVFREPIISILSRKWSSQIFQSREEAMYLIRLSQCKIQQSFQAVYSRDNLYQIKCAHPPCHFHLKVSNSKTGDHLSSGNTQGHTRHTCVRRNAGPSMS